MTMSVAVQGKARVGEGPCWDAESSTLHWVDILAGQIYSSNISTGHTTFVHVETMVGAAVPRRHHRGFVAATAEGFAEITASGELITRCPVLPDGQRMNDAKCDSLGRLWAGSTDLGFAAGAGQLHLLNPDFSSRIMLSGLSLPNGMGWSPDGRTFYLIDTIEREICAFEVDLADCVLSSRRVLRSFAEDAGLPDGMCVDTLGCLWVAIWGGNRVERISPGGALLGTFAVPVRQPSSCAFGGPDLGQLFITSAREGLDLSPDDQDGSVFVLAETGARGLPVSVFAG